MPSGLIFSVSTFFSFPSADFFFKANALAGLFVLICRHGSVGDIPHKVLH